MRAMPPPALSETPVAVLVTGASGFVGLNVVEHLLRAGQTVIGVSGDDFPAVARSEFAGLAGDLQAVSADVRDMDAIASLTGAADVVIHAAAVTASASREKTAARRIIEVNIGGTQALLDAATASGRVDRFVYVSSGAVYGERAFGSMPIDEETPPQPVSLYAITKLAAELLTRRHGELHGMETVSARLSAVFGPWERDTGVRDFLSPMYQLAVAAHHGEPVTLGRSAPRNWLYARDAAAALVHLAVGPTPNHQLYNVSPTEWVEPRTWADRLVAEYPGWGQAAGGVTTLTHDAPPERVRAAIENGRICSELPGWPEYDPAGAFDHYVGWLREHPQPVV